MNNLKIIIVLNSAWNAVNFRKNLICSLKKKKFKIFIVAPRDEFCKEIINMGCNFIHHDFFQRKTNIIYELISFIKLQTIFYTVKPDICISFTIKPNLYSSILCRFLKIPIINNITGMGFFEESNLVLKKFISAIYKFSLLKSNHIFFQNREDFNYFKQKKFITHQSTGILPGSGVDITRFTNLLNQNTSKKNKFLFASRLLISKGIIEYCKAASLIKSKYPSTQFLIIGELKDDEKYYITTKELNKYQEKGIVKYIGFKKNVIEYMSSVNCVVLPTFYNEGTPKVILEASALKIPVITTNTKGCNYAVKDNENGFLCEPKNHVDLSYKIEKFIKLKINDKLLMGERGRVRVEKYFDENIVIKKYERAIKYLLNK